MVQSWGQRADVLSTQVLAFQVPVGRFGNLLEFYVNVTTKIASPLSKPSAQLLWTAMSSGALIPRGLRLPRLSILRMSAYRVLGRADHCGARKAYANRILTEDLNAGQIISGIQIENPFSRLVMKSAYP
jgi:hypothetical protein